MKKAIVLTIALVLALSFCIHTSAVESNHIIIINNVEVIFDANSSLTIEEKQLVAEYIVNEQSDIHTYGLICNLFGHKNNTEIVTTITHRVSASVPRCLEEEWEIITCSRCGNTETTRISYAFRNCCPEE